MDPQDIVSLVLGIWGAGLSTALAFRQFRHDKRRVKVTCAPALLTTPDLPELIMITAVNTGHRTVTITSAFLLLNDDTAMLTLESRVSRLTGGWPLPARLADGESVTIYIDMDDVEAQVRELQSQDPTIRLAKAIVKDAEGNTYRAKMPRLLKDRGLA
jgi:hypothetical protein